MPIDSVLDGDWLVVLHLHGAVDVEVRDVHQLAFVLVGYSLHGFRVMYVPVKYKDGSLSITREVRRWFSEWIVI